jgi:response regulator of citrate/malate metabolism
LSTLLVAPPGATSEALAGVLQSLPEVNFVDTVTGCLSAAEVMQETEAQLVVVSGLVPPDEIIALIKHPAREKQMTRVIVLSSTHALRARFVEAGAFAVISPWESVESLRTVVAFAATQGQ